MVGVGVQQVQCHGADFAAGIRGFFAVLRTGQVKKRVEGFVALQVRGLQGKPQAAVQGIGAAQGAVEQRPVAGFVYDFANRPLAFDEKGFVAHCRWQPLAVRHVVQAAALAFELLQEYILVIAHRQAHAPCHLAVKAGKQRRQARNGCPGSLVFRGANLHIAPCRRHAYGLMDIVGQQALAAAAALWANGPVAGCRNAWQAQLFDLLKGLGHAAQALQLAAQGQALELVGFAGGQGFVGVGGHQPGQFVGADFLRQRQGVELFLQVG